MIRRARGMRRMRRKGKGLGSFFKGLFSRGKKLVDTGKKIYSRGKDFYDKNKDTIHSVAKTASDAYNTIQPHVKKMAEDAKQPIKESVDDVKAAAPMVFGRASGSGMRGMGMRGGRRVKRAHRKRR